MQGYKQPCAYIATQGPLPNTTDNFWRMTWEQNSRIIVMVTQCKERSRVKCHQYWPTSNSTKYGKITVHFLSEKKIDKTGEWLERKFCLECGVSKPTMKLSIENIENSLQSNNSLSYF